MNEPIAWLVYHSHGEYDHSVHPYRDEADDVADQHDTVAHPLYLMHPTLMAHPLPPPILLKEAAERLILCEYGGELITDRQGVTHSRAIDGLYVAKAYLQLLKENQQLQQQVAELSPATATDNDWLAGFPQRYMLGNPVAITKAQKRLLSDISTSQGLYWTSGRGYEFVGRASRPQFRSVLNLVANGLLVGQPGQDRDQPYELRASKKGLDYLLT